MAMPRRDPRLLSETGMYVCVCVCVCVCVYVCVCERMSEWVWMLGGVWMGVFGTCCESGMYLFLSDATTYCNTLQYTATH